MNTKSAILCILIIAALFLTQAVDLAHAESFDGRSGKTSASARQNDVTITCPARVVYQAIPMTHSIYSSSTTTTVPG